MFLFSPSTPLRAVSLSNGRFDTRHRYQNSPVRFFKMLRLLRHLFSHSKFDVGRSMFDVHLFILLNHLLPDQKSATLPGLSGRLSIGQTFRYDITSVWKGHRQVGAVGIWPLHRP